MNKGQSHKHSFYEIATDMTIAFFVAWGVQIFIFPFYGIHVSIAISGELTLIFTIASLIRRWITRRFWNWIHVRWG